MKVLCDLHHGELYYSLQLLFEKRLNAEMYRPIGMEWYHEGFWNVYPHIDTANQYLGLNSSSNIPKDIHGNNLPRALWGNVDYRIEDGIYYVTDFTKGAIQRGITLDKLKSMKFDIVIASMPCHVSRFQKLIKLYQPQAKLIFQIGNPGWRIPSDVKNVLNSTTPHYVPPGINTVEYHQEFDLETFKYIPPINNTTVNSYIHYMPKLDLLDEYKKLLSDYSFTTYGAGMDKSLFKSLEIARAMQDSGWTWHMKPLGDGYGHTLHNTYACGRPVIIKKSYYHNMIGEKLLEDQETCIDIGAHSLQENISLIRRFSEPDNHQSLCERAYKRFKNVVNFDEEEIKIRKFISRLQ
jgi:hypothetical protein